MNSATVLTFPARPIGHGIEVEPGHIGATELRERSGISFRQLDYWTRTGILQPDPQPRNSPGFPITYPISELHVATLVSRLLAGGLNLRPAHALARQLIENGRAEIAGFPIHLPEET